MQRHRLVVAGHSMEHHEDRLEPASAWRSGTCKFIVWNMPELRYPTGAKMRPERSIRIRWAFPKSPNLHLAKRGGCWFERRSS